VVGASRPWEELGQKGKLGEVERVQRNEQSLVLGN